MHSWQVATGVIAILGTGVAGFALARLPHNRIRLPLYLFVLSGVLWATGDVIADGANDMATKQLGISILYTGSIMLPPLWWFVTLCWAEDAGSRLPLRARAWRFAPLYWAGAMWLIMITNPWHGTFVTPIVGGRNLYQPGWFMTAIPSYAEVFASLAVSIAVVLELSRPAVRRQGAFIIMATSVTLLGNILYVAGIAPVNPTVIYLSLSISMIVVAMARDGLFGVIPAGLSQISADHPNGVVIVDADGYVAYANERARALIAPVILPTDRPLFDVLQDVRLKLDTACAGASITPTQFWQAASGRTGVLLRIDVPTRRWLQIVGSNVQDASNRTRGFLLDLSDVTERQQAEIQARQRRRLDSLMSLAHSVSRDFRGAFGLIHANANLLAAELGESPSQRHVARIFEAARMGAQLVQDLETYTGNAETVRVRFDLAVVVEEACRLVSTNVPPQIRFHHRPQRAALPIEADPIQVRECLLSLITNAIEATASVGREVEVSTGLEVLDPAQTKGLVYGTAQPAGRFAYVEVRDEGAGMNPDIEERAFEPFFSTREKNRGSGLASVLGIARANAAAVALYNDPGWGCTFTVYFPLREA